MKIPVSMEIQLVLIVIMGIAGLYQYFIKQKSQNNQSYILDYALTESIAEQQRIETQKKLALAEEEQMRNQAFFMDVLIQHGSAFGGFSAFLSDGRRRKGLVTLEQIMMYGKHPSGNEFTYYIEEQGLEICPTDDPDSILIRSKSGPFEIRDAGVGRDQGISTTYAVIRKDILYYIVLESKHEISIKASKAC